MRRKEKWKWASHALTSHISYFTQRRSIKTDGGPEDRLEVFTLHIDVNPSGCDTPRFRILLGSSWSNTKNDWIFHVREINAAPFSGIEFYLELLPSNFILARSLAFGKGFVPTITYTLLVPRFSILFLTKLVSLYRAATSSYSRIRNEYEYNTWN